MGKQTIIRAVAGYAIAFAAFTIILTLVGSFVAWEWWTPFRDVGTREMLAWVSVTGLIPAIVKSLP